MNRRTFIRLLAVTPIAIPALAKAFALSKPVTTRLQTSPVAGFQYYQGEQLWPRLRVNDPLVLIREPENKYDRRAVGIYWKKQKLGYLPQAKNRMVSRLMDSRFPLTAKITNLERSGNPWKRVAVAVDMRAD